MSSLSWLLAYLIIQADENEGTDCCSVPAYSKRPPYKAGSKRLSFPLYTNTCVL